MRHRKKKQKLGSSFHQRKAILRSLANAVILKGRIATTEGKAKKVKPFLEKAITKSRENTLANRRLLLMDFTPRIVDKLIKEIGPKYVGHSGGYTRIMKTVNRKSDSAKMVFIELINPVK
ncbi:MAG: 50S ribosomal protein L17 [Candidatus Portnoybacteria bacterium]|nr:50S ribosomal protein L17 [Candidatus Portnoybacteria bacterium]